MATPRHVTVAMLANPKRITLAMLKTKARELACTVRKRDGEYRINVKGKGEDCAYYTDDAADAWQTMEAMHRGASQRGTIA